MSEDRNFDNFIKGEFKNYSPNVPSHIWDNIVAEREKRKPVGFWFTLFSGANLVWLIALIAVGVSGTLVISHNLKTSADNKTVVANNNSNNNPISTNNSNSTGSTNTQPIAAIDNNTTSTPTPVSSQTNTPNQQAFPEPADNAGIGNQTVAGKRRHDTSGRLHIKTTNGTIGIDDDAVPSNTSLDNTTVSSNENPIGSGISTNPFYKSSNKTYDNNTRAAFDKASLLSFNLKSAPASLHANNMRLPECPTIEKEAAGNKKYIEVYIAPDYAIRTLRDTANSVYLQKRKATTSVSSAFSAGIRYTKVFNNGMSIRFGLNYSQINETFTYVQGNVVQTTYNINPVTGDTTGSYTVRGTNYKTTYNHYRYFDIPVTIGYEFGNGRFHTNINAGIIANIYSWQKGDELDANLQPVSITTGKGPDAYQFRTNIGLGATGGASFYYKLTDELHVFAEPYVRYNFQPLSNSNLSLRQNYTTMGLRLGLRLDLHNPGSIINK